MTESCLLLHEIISTMLLVRLLNKLYARNLKRSEETACDRCVSCAIDVTNTTDDKTVFSLAQYIFYFRTDKDFHVC